MGYVVGNFMGFDIEMVPHPGGANIPWYAGGGCSGPSISDVEACIYNNLTEGTSYTPGKGSNEPESPEKPDPPSDDTSSGGNWWENPPDWWDNPYPSGGGAEAASGGSGTTSSGGMSSASTTASQASPAVPDWMQKRMEYWDEKQKQLLEAATAAYHYSGQKYEEAWKQVGEKSREAAMDLAKKYGQGIGVLAQGQSQQQSALARYAATGRMSGGSAEQAMTSAARETATGAMGAYQSYAGGRAALADTMMKTYAAFGQEASTYTQMVVDAMKAVPDPYRDWANFMSGLTGFSAVVVA